MKPLHALLLLALLLTIIIWHYGGRKVDVTGSLVLDYAFNTQTGNTTPDASAYSHTGTLHNGASVGGQGRDGAGLVCDGTDDYVDTGTAALLPDGATESTIAIWMRPTEVGRFQALMGNYWGGGGQGWMLVLDTASKVRWQQAYAIGASEQFSHPTPITANTWTFVGVRVNNSRVTIWNGRNKAETTFTSANTILRSDYAVRLCHRRPAGTTAEYFNGILDNVRVWTRALTDAEIEAYLPCLDADADSYSPGDQPGCTNGDCDDANPLIHPGAQEYCLNTVDDDCDGSVYNGCNCIDSDSDHWYYANCAPLGDCNDTDPSVYPGATETCNGRDDNCDSTIDEGCLCVGGQTQPCGSSIGECETGTQTCTAGAWGACTGAVEPTTETCNGLDDDCNSATDDGIAPQQCGTTDVGACEYGTQTCAASAWAACSGNIEPTTETCNGVDDDCDGTADEGCACTGGQTRPCGTDTGECAQGTQTCTSGAWGLCTGSTGPATETCANNKDEDCDGQTDENCCGNGVLDPGEACDGALLGSQTCAADPQYSGGTLACLPTCQAYDAAACTPIPLPNQTCTSNWQCDPWGPCTHSHQARTCVDFHACTTPTNTPETDLTCNEWITPQIIGPSALAIAGLLALTIILIVRRKKR